VRYLLTGGGTGGHVYPALAIKELIAREDADAEFLYAGTAGKAEEYILNSLEGSERIPLECIHASGLPRKLAPLQIFTFVRNLLLGFHESRGIIRKFKPDIIIATGGYVSAPVILAGWFGRKKILLHEQNSVPGLVNRILGRIATRVLTTFEDSAAYFNKNKTAVAGYPVRRRITALKKDAARKKMGIRDDAQVVFVFGGSGGAKIINDTIIRHLEFLLAGGGSVIIHGTGRDRPGIYEAYTETKHLLETLYPSDFIKDRYILRDYFDDIDVVYSAADLIVCRAGAGTIMECAAMGLPMILVPKSGLPGNHQEKNARTAEQSGGAVVVREEFFKNQAILDGEKLSRIIVETAADPEKLRSMSSAIRKIYTKDAARLIAGEINRLVAH